MKSLAHSHAANEGRGRTTAQVSQMSKMHLHLHCPHGLQGRARVQRPPSDREDSANGMDLKSETQEDMKSLH